MWIPHVCSSTILCLSIVSGLFAPHPWLYCRWFSPLAFCFSNMHTHPGHSRNNSLVAMLDLTHLTSQPLLEVSSSSDTSALSVPTPVVTSTPVLLSQRNLIQAFFQALGESLLQLVVALQGHVHSTNSSAGESVSWATTAASSSVITSLGSLSA